LINQDISFLLFSFSLLLHCFKVYFFNRALRRVLIVSIKNKLENNRKCFDNKV